MGKFCSLNTLFHLLLLTAIIKHRTLLSFSLSKTIQNPRERMEQKLPIMGKKVWSLIRAMFFMLKKGITNIKFFADLDMVIKLGKIAGKALHNLLFHHHHKWANSATFHSHPHHIPSGEHEFSCSHTPPNPISLFSTHKKRQTKRRSLPNIPHAPPSVDDIDGIYFNPELLNALDMLTSVTGSPAILGPRKTPMVKQVRVTDSPFPLSNGDEDGEVDEAAEKFIMRFYNGLRRQDYTR